MEKRPLLKPEHFKRMIRDLYDIQMEFGVYAAYLGIFKLIFLN